MSYQLHCGLYNGSFTPLHSAHNIIIILQQLLSRPGRNFNRLDISFNQDRITSPEPPVVNLSCSGVADDQTGLYTVHIEFSYANVSLINEAINEYSIYHSEKA